MSRGPGSRGRITDAKVEEVIVKTLESTPRDATHWSTRSMAAEVGLTQSAVHRIWKAFGLQPHRQDTWKLSRDPLFIDKVRDVVGLYLNPPERAVVLCVDEKSQIQALDRTAPILPMLPGTPERATHDYKRSRHLEPLRRVGHHDRQGHRPLHSRHRAIEFKQFLQTIDREVPADLDVHVVLDNSSTHKTPAIQKWLAAHPRFVLHFTPTSSSWLNLVERWFAELTTKKLRRGTHRSVRELNADIRAWIETWNDDPKPYVWTKTADQILESIATYCTANQRITTLALLQDRLERDEVRVDAALDGVLDEHGGSGNVGLGLQCHERAVVGRLERVAVDERRRAAGRAHRERGRRVALDHLELVDGRAAREPTVHDVAPVPARLDALDRRVPRRDSGRVREAREDVVDRSRNGDIRREGNR